VTTRELTREDIEHLVQSFEVGAETVKTAGVDAIELNFHAGYLGDEFMTALWNMRTDRYGGNLEGRLRFPLEIIAATKRGAGADFPIIFKFGLSHHLEGGREITEGLEIARRLEAAGVDALTIDAGCYETQYWTFPSAYQPQGCMVDLAEMVKNAVGISVIAVGKLGYADLAEQVLRDEKADFIALGRTLLADPDWPKKVREGKLEDIRPCIGDFEGCSRRAIEQKYVSCTVNPATGIEREFTIGLAKEKKSVLIVGGGPGGMEAAIVAKLRGHEVTLWEKGDTLGGNLIPASIPDFKQDYKRLVDYLSVQVRKLGVNLELNKEATPELIRQLNPRVLVVATGSTPMIPEIPDGKRGTLFTAPDILLSKGEVGDSVVILGGGLVGCETALYLKQKGKEVTIVEVLDDVMRDVFPANRMFLLELLADVQILTNTKVLRVTDNGLAVENEDSGERILRTDTVVVAIGFQPNRVLLESLDGEQLETYAIGDCVEPRKLISAMWEGFRTARLI
jgi:2-enoate reductase